MMARRHLLGAGASLLAGVRARAQSGLWPEWLGSYAGAVRFYRSIPLEDIYPPPEHPHVDLDDPAPFAVYFTIRAEDGAADGLAAHRRRPDADRRPTARRCASAR